MRISGYDTKARINHTLCASIQKQKRPEYGGIDHDMVQTRILFALMHRSYDVPTPFYHIAEKIYPCSVSLNRSIINVCGVDTGPKCRVRGSCVSKPLTLASVVLA